MGTPEKFEPGDNVMVKSCDRSIPFCVVSADIKSRQEKGNDRIPLSTPSCECLQSPDQVEKIPSKLP